MARGQNARTAASGTDPRTRQVTVALLMIGWTTGAHWGHTLSAAWMIFFVTILLLLHDAAIAILLAMAAIKAPIP
jgi:hypothetical protein